LGQSVKPIGKFHDSAILGCMSIFLQYLLKGSVITWMIYILGLWALVISIARLLHFHRAQINVPEFLRGIINTLKRKNVLEAVSICDETPGPTAHIVRAAILRCDQNHAAKIQAVADARLSEIPRLERHLKVLNTIIYLAPLLGLLGTVCGMIALFHKMETGGTFLDIKNMSGPIWQALLSTAAGLSVAIPSFLIYNYFIARMKIFVLEMEKAASEIIYFLNENQLQLENADAITHNDSDSTDSTSGS